MNTYHEHTKYIIVDENGKPTNEKFKTITILPTTTNGDVINAMFPNASVYMSSGKVCVDFGDGIKTFSVEWLNAPYKAGE